MISTELKTTIQGAYSRFLEAKSLKPRYGQRLMIAEVAKVMTSRRIRHMPVVEGERLVGIISVGDILKHRSDELEMEANVMRDYAVARH